MAGRAQWRRLPGDPRSGLGWLVRDGRRWTRLGLRRGIVAALGLAASAAVLGAFVPAALLVGTAFCLAGLVPAVERGPTPAEPSPGQAFVGTVEVRRAGAWLGEDRVVATFVDGWLHVEGLRASFALRSEEVREVEGATLTLEDGSTLRFRVDLGPRDPTRSDFHKGLDGATFERRLQRWLVEPIPQGVPILPPDRPHPSARTRVGADLVAAALALGAGVTVAWSVEPAWGIFAFLLVPGPTIDRAIRDAVRLKRLPEEG